jgi:hypothetical protein
MVAIERPPSIQISSSPWLEQQIPRQKFQRRSRSLQDGEKANVSGTRTAVNSTGFQEHARRLVLAPAGAGEAGRGRLAYITALNE